MFLSSRDEELEHLVRAIREKATNYRDHLDEGNVVSELNVASVLGQSGALRMLGIHTGVESILEELGEWVWFRTPWQKIKEERSV